MVPVKRGCCVICVKPAADHLKLPVYLYQMGPSQARQTPWLSTSLTRNLQLRRVRVRMMDVFSLLMLNVTQLLKKTY